jgi:hypothetical protein
MKWLIAFLVLLAATPSWAAITVEGTASSGGVQGSTTITFSHNSGASGSNCITIVGIAWRESGGTTAISTITFNGDSLTQKESVFNGATVYGALWRILAPDRTTADVVVTFSEATNAAAGAQTYCGVDQVTPFGTATTRNSSADADTLSAISVTSAVGELVVDVLARNNGDETVTVGAGQTQEYQQDGPETDATDRRLAASREAGAASVDMRWTWATGSSVGHIGIPLKPAAAAGSGTSGFQPIDM